MVGFGLIHAHYPKRTKSQKGLLITMPKLTSSIQAAAGAALIAAILSMAGYTVRGFFPALAWAAVLGIGLWPIHLKIQNKLGINAASSAILLTTAVALIFILPITWLSVQAVTEAGPFIQWLNDASQNGVPAPDWVNHLPFGRDTIATWWNTHLATTNALKQTYTSLKQPQSLQHGQTLVLKIAHRVTLILFTIVTIFFFLKDGSRLAARARELSMELIGPTGETILLQVVSSIRGTISGLVLVGLGEGIIIGLSYFAFGLSHAALLTIVTAVAAMLPFCAVVVVLIAGLIALGSSQIAAIFIVAFGLAVIFVADHFVRPKLIGGSTNMPFLMVLFGILGGLETWGLIGLFIGPALMAVVMMFWTRPVQR